MRPRARLLNLVGEELISDEPVAVVELVKNAFDADASKVSIRFEGQAPEQPERIVIEDDGHGMSLDVVLGAWLEPGTVHKKHLTSSPAGRTFQGAKGIGRFAAARLAHNLLLQSRSGDGREVTVMLEWDQFDDERYLDEIEIDYEVAESDKETHGTTLSLERVRKATWTREDYESLHQRLSRLVSPFRDVPDFEIFLDIPEHFDLSGVVEPPDMVLQPMYVLKGQVNKEGVFVGGLRASAASNPHVRDEDIIKPLTLKLGDVDKKPTCGGFEVEIRAWDRDRESLEPYFVNQLGNTITKVRSTLNAFCGVSIYRDGFRVYPYGETGNDWLYLDNRSRQNPTTRLANNQIVGAIKISRDDNPDLKDRSNREGLVANNAYRDLAAWFELVLQKLEEFRYPIRPRDGSSGGPAQMFEDLDLTEFLRELKQRVGDDPELEKVIEEQREIQKRGIERIQETFSRMLRSAGLGQMVDIVIHEIGTPLGKISRQRLIIGKVVEKNVAPPALEKVSAEVERLAPWIDEISALRGRLEPQSPAKRGRATSFSVKDEIEDTLSLYQSLIDKQGVEVVLDYCADEVRVRMARSSLTQVLANLVDNALGWIRYKYGSGKGGVLKIALDTSKSGFVVRVSDDGVGVPEGNRGFVFEPYFSTKSAGMGLGLHISRLVIEPYGRLLLSEVGELGGATFEAYFEKGVGR
ncbi:sensor histidine kinase [Algiphilus sp.]